jgi:dihydrodipicolinate synthase/N-acetylneuraminate lyase
MRAQPLQPADYAASVVAVPPLALRADLSVNAEANTALVRHIEAGGVRILLYGGNANLYHIDLGRFRTLVELLAGAAGPQTAVVPSIGPDYGKMLDQAPILRAAGLHDAMLLPTGFPADTERGVRDVVQALGFSVVLYVKRDAYLPPARLEALVRDGAVRFVKYAVERAEPATDPYLSDILSAVGRQRVASGMGETPLHAHLPQFGLATYTSGGVCIAPAASMALLAAYRAGDLARAEELRAPFLDFERVRTRLGGISVLHDAVTMSGIADMGPVLPLLSNVPERDRAEVRRVTDRLLAVERSVGQRRAA